MTGQQKDDKTRIMTKYSLQPLAVDTEGLIGFWRERFVGLSCSHAAVERVGVKKWCRLAASGFSALSWFPSRRKFSE
jgi:hypothetical protein